MVVVGSVWRAPTEGFRAMGGDCMCLSASTCLCRVLILGSDGQVRIVGQCGRWVGDGQDLDLLSIPMYLEWVRAEMGS
jgi:hypothetical protein